MSREAVVRLLMAQGGAASRRQLKEAGCSARTVEEMVRRRELVRVRRDAVILAEALVDATPWQVRALEARAVGLSLASAVRPTTQRAVPDGGSPKVEDATPGPTTGDATASPTTGDATASPAAGDATPSPTTGDATPSHALSHESALMIHGLPYFGEDGQVHLVRTDGRRGRRDGTVWVHSPVDAGWVVDVDGLRVLMPALAALQVAATHGVEAGLVALDGVLHEARRRDKVETGRTDGSATAEALRQIAEALSLPWGPRTGVVTLVAELADGRAESAGESRSRWLLHQLGLGPMTPQFPVRDGPVLVGLGDLKLDRWDVIVEFDGTGKYTGPSSLLAEKDREDRIRALGYEVVRLRWADLDRPHLVRQRVLAAIARAEARAATVG